MRQFSITPSQATLLIATSCTSLTGQLSQLCSVMPHPVGWRFDNTAYQEIHLGTDFEANPLLIPTRYPVQMGNGVSPWSQVTRRT